MTSRWFSSTVFRFSTFAFFGLAGLILVVPSQAEDFIPRRQDKPPGPALSPAEAIAKMTVPEGFKVEVVASEPDIVNPVAMTFDERGRVWVTESLEYPRHEAGPGQDRIKVLEDTDGDGRADKFTVFAEGLNIPSGIAVGHGGVWVANAPDILFMQDTDGDGRADKKEIIVTGFGRFDTHELPNSLTWGPDGWLYGLNGVFNRSQVDYRGKHYDFTCALFRIHPKTRDFELFCEGTSNPWGVAWDNEGSAFISACVIDHLWHLTENGYYIRQGGPYPPFTSILPSIVTHKHQMAAYCGIHYFDSDAYPAEYREKLYMGNIHGNCINVDKLQRDGATYHGVGEPDFLSGNDVWFMPVVQKTGPDGCLYVLDWYDRYHCYQDASRDPVGVDRLKGRLYRVRYKDSPRAEKFDLAKKTDEQLLARLASPNVYFRDIAQRLLIERGLSGTASDAAATRDNLQHLVLDDAAPRKLRMHGLWSLIGRGPLDREFHQKLLAHSDASLRAWGVRAAGNAHAVEPPIREAVIRLSQDRSPDVRLQVAIAATKLKDVEPLPVLLEVLSTSADDKLIPQIVWQNLHPLLEKQSDAFLDRLANGSPGQLAAVKVLLPKVVERILGRKEHDPAPLARLFDLLRSGPVRDSAAAQRFLALLATKVQSREIAADQVSTLKDRLQSAVQPVLAAGASDPLFFDTAVLATSWQDPIALETVRAAFNSQSESAARRQQAMLALVGSADGSLSTAVAALLSDPKAAPLELRAATLDALGRLHDAWVPKVVLANYDRLEPELQPRAIELLTQRGDWAHELLDAVAAKRVPASMLGANQIRKLLSSPDAKLVAKAKNQWGSVRTERSPGREQVIYNMRMLFLANRGDAEQGQVVFRKLCGQCHKIHGEGQEVGPDITVNGRSNFDQLLSNVFDPSLVIGAAYQARTVITADGRVLTGLVAEDNDQRVVLKQQGGKLETIPRADIDEMKDSKLSLMPEDLEKQLKPQELIDLFAFLSLDKPPSDPAARQLPGMKPALVDKAKGK